tara:strand:- start:3675 stop:5402 length:1728 start_codon:yes stop_codon:yes gene_type:complete
MGYRLLLWLTVTAASMSSLTLQAEDDENNPRWFKTDQLLDGKYLFYCDAEGDNEETTLQSARGACLQKMCYLFGEQIEARTVIEETLTDTKVDTKIINSCPKVRIIGRTEVRKSVDCFGGSCSAFVMQEYPEKEYKAEWERLNRPKIAPELQALLKSFAEPPPEKTAEARFVIKGDPQKMWDHGISQFSVTIDNSEVRRCSSESLNDSCELDTAVSAGEHAVYVYTYNNKKHPLNARTTVTQVYWFPPGASVSIDLSAVSIKSGEQDQASRGGFQFEKVGTDYPNFEILNSLSVQGVPVIDGCRAALWQISALPTCRAEDLVKFQPALAQVKQLCLSVQNDLPSDGWAERLLDFTEANISEKSISHCYASSTIKYMPYAVNRGFKDMWPAPHANMTTWSWARTLNTNQADTTQESPQEGAKLWTLRLADIEASLPQISERLELADTLISIFTSDNDQQVAEGLQNFLAILAQEPFDLDPLNTYGHFNYYLLNKSFKREIPRTSEISERLAEYVKTQPKIRCDNKFYSYYIFHYFRDDKVISATERSAIEAMMNNSSSTQNRQPCARFLQRWAESP